MERSEGDFSEALLSITEAMLAAARGGEWDTLNALSAQRETMITSEAGRRPPTPGSEDTWRRVEALNREALALAELHLQHLDQGVQAKHNQQRLQKHYGS